MSAERPASGEPEEIAEYPRPDEAARDGIGEEDNEIPLWFNLSFLATIVFAVFYVPYYHLHLGWSAAAQYEAEVAAAREKGAAVAAAIPDQNPFRGDAAAVAAGKQQFETICAACHKPDGTGMVGPSLVDPYWKYGASDAERFETVANGRPGGMPPWKAQLGNDGIWQVLAYVDTLPRSDEPGVGAPGYAAPGN